MNYFKQCVDTFEFRAKRINNDYLVYGLLSFYKGELVIITEDKNTYHIKPESVQQYIRLKDKNNNKIFEGDKIKNIEGKVFIVVFSNVKGLTLQDVNSTFEYINGSSFWIDECEIV